MENHLMSLRAYARHRKANGLSGQSLRATQKAIAAKRITTVIDDRGRVRILPAEADIQWAINTDPARVNAGRRATLPGDPGNSIQRVVFKASGKLRAVILRTWKAFCHG